MIEVRRILCPIDFSDHSRRALDHAVALARHYGSTITVLHVVPPRPGVAVGATPVVFGPIVSGPADHERVLADVRAFMTTGSATGLRIDALVCEGNTAAEILDQAAAMKADLLVMGTHGRSGYDRLLLGSVTEKVLWKASCPVMTVPHGGPGAVPFGPIPYQRILCPIDFSESSLQALKFAVSLAQSGTQVTVLHVVTPELEDTSQLESGAGMTVGEFLKEREDALARQLRRVVAGAANRASIEPLMAHGKPWREVLRVAAERHSDLLVMGVQGRGAARLFFLGSTTQHVVRQASCPVLTLRQGVDPPDPDDPPTVEEPS